jgi:hypothetical protein
VSSKLFRDTMPSRPPHGDLTVSEAPNRPPKRRHWRSPLWHTPPPFYARWRAEDRGRDECGQENADGIKNPSNTDAWGET